MINLDSAHGSAVALLTVSQPHANAFAAEGWSRLRRPKQEARS